MSAYSISDPSDVDAQEPTLELLYTSLLHFDLVEVGAAPAGDDPVPIDVKRARAVRNQRSSASAARKSLSLGLDVR